MEKNTPQLIVALDVPTLEEASNIVETLGDKIAYYKVGSQLFTACGPMAVRYLLAQDKNVFLDLKYHDIPNTVEINGFTVPRAEGVPLVRLGCVWISSAIRGHPDVVCRRVPHRAITQFAISPSPPLGLSSHLLKSESFYDNRHFE